MGNIAQYQPWSKDNIKLLYCWVFIASGVISLGLIKLFNSEKQPQQRERGEVGLGIAGGNGKDLAKKVVVTVVIVSLVFSGLLAAFSENRTKYPLYDKQDEVFGEWLKLYTNPKDVFLTSEHHIQPVSVLAGRSQLVSYPLWMWLHGYDFSQRLTDVGTILSCRLGQPEVERLLKEYSVRYLVLDSKLIESGIRMDCLEPLITRNIYNDGRYEVARINVSK